MAARSVPSSPAATSSSSAKNAFPPDRAWIDSRSAASRSSPAIARSCRLASPSVEREELDPLDPAAPLQLGEERQQRVAPVELVGAVGEDAA